MSHDLDMPPARGGRKPSGVIPQYEVVRELTLADLALRQASNSKSKPVANLPAPLLRGELRAAHHQLAQLAARSAPSAEIQLITGYSASYISNIKHDPAFKELVAYYTAENHDLYIDVLARMRDTGVAAVEELQSRLRAEAPTNDFTKRELMEVVDLTIVKPMSAVANARRGVDPRPGNDSQQTNVNIKFVQAQPATVTVEHES